MNRTLKYLNYIDAMFIFATGLFGPIYARFTQQIGGDLISTGIAYSIFAIASGLLLLFISRWEDRAKHKEKIMAFGYGLSVIGYLGYMACTNMYQLFALELLFGISTAVTVPVFDELYSENLSHGRFSSEWGFWEAMTMLATGVSSFIGGLIAGIFGFRALFLLMAMFGMVGLLVSVRLAIEKARGRPNAH